MAIITDLAVSADVRVEEKEKEEVEKYQDLEEEIRRLWKLRNVETLCSCRIFVKVFLRNFVGGWES